jgi:hypothetical protein
MMNMTQRAYIKAKAFYENVEDHVNLFVRPAACILFRRSRPLADFRS